MVKTLEGDVKDPQYNHYEKVETALHPAALHTKARFKALGARFRQHDGEGIMGDELDCRPAFQKDRDKIVWSKSFKRLQNKTQVFPHGSSDHLRRRLTHSLEVSALASAIAQDLNLNTFAAEAMALGHDLGHTPFGHAGEEALNSELIQCLDGLDKGPKKRKGFKKWVDYLPVPLYGFDHCAFAIEVVEYIERRPSLPASEYRCGLNLTWDVRDGILHHKYNSTVIDPKNPYKQLENICKHRLFQEYGKRSIKGRVPSPCVCADYVSDRKHSSLESQCVWFADKLAYLVGDIEDGLSAGILKYEDIYRDAFFEMVMKKAEAYKFKPPTNINRENFKIFRNMILDVSVRDCVDTSRKRLKTIKTLDDVFQSEKPVICVDEKMWSLRNKFYAANMEKRLFSYHDVKLCSVKAGNIVRTLFQEYYKHPDLVPKHNSDATRSVYGGPIVDIKDDNILNIIVARNYVACMSDQFALSQFREIKGISDTNII